MSHYHQQVYDNNLYFYDNITTSDYTDLNNTTAISNSDYMDNNMYSNEYFHHQQQYVNNNPQNMVDYNCIREKQLSQEYIDQYLFKNRYRVSLKLKNKNYFKKAVTV